METEGMDADILSTTHMKNGPGRMRAIPCTTATKRSRISEVYKIACMRSKKKNY
jgi:hypothetical protein